MTIPGLFGPTDPWPAILLLFLKYLKSCFPLIYPLPIGYPYQILERLHLSKRASIYRTNSKRTETHLMKMTRQIAFLLIILSAFATTHIAPAATIWQIGKADNSSAEFALAPNRYAQFIENDFGWEDRFYLIGFSSAKADWPYVLPGPSDKWGGTWGDVGVAFTHAEHFV